MGKYVDPSYDQANIVFSPSSIATLAQTKTSDAKTGAGELPSAGEVAYSRYFEQQLELSPPGGVVTALVRYQ